MALQYGLIISCRGKYVRLSQARVAPQARKCLIVVLKMKPLSLQRSNIASFILFGQRNAEWSFFKNPYHLWTAGGAVSLCYYGSLLLCVGLGLMAKLCGGVWHTHFYRKERTPRHVGVKTSSPRVDAKAHLNCLLARYM